MGCSLQAPWRWFVVLVCVMTCNIPPSQKSIPKSALSQKLQEVPKRARCSNSPFIYINMWFEWFYQFTCFLVSHGNALNETNLFCGFAPLTIVIWKEDGASNKCVWMLMRDVITDSLLLLSTVLFRDSISSVWEEKNVLSVFWQQFLGWDCWNVSWIAHITIKIFHMYVINPYIFEVVHLQDLVSAVSHPEHLDALRWIDFHQALSLHSIQYGFILIVIYLFRHIQLNITNYSKNTMPQEYPVRSNIMSHLK